MRHLITVGAALVALLLGSAGAHGEEAGGWVGERVITRPGTVLKIGRKAVADDQRGAGSMGGQRPPVCVYRVERVTGPWLWLVALHEGNSGWARATQVVHCDRALDEFTSAIGANPKDARAFVARGILWHEKGEYDQAIADLTEATRFDAKYALAYYYRGRAWFEKDAYDQAIADFDEAIRLDPKYAMAYTFRGEVRGEKGGYDKAIADCNEAIRLDSHCARAYNNRGCGWHEKGAYDQAIADLNEAIRLDPNSATKYANRGGVRHAKGEYDKAIADCSEAIRLDPRSANAYDGGGLIWATCPDEKHRDGKHAVESATRACELTHWKTAKTLGTLAAACAEVGDFDAAVKWQERQLELTKDEIEAEIGRECLALYRAKKPYRDEPVVAGKHEIQNPKSETNSKF